jgi:hypothetical protein
MGVVYSIRWRLVYLDDRMLDEPPQGSTILERWPNPVELHLMDITGQSVMRVPIPVGYKPIFYRRRSVAMNFGTGQQGDAQLEGTVFGYGKETSSDGKARLWMWSKGQAVNCPQTMIDQSAIEHLLMG